MGVSSRSVKKKISPPSYPRTMHIGDLEVTFRLMNAADVDLMLGFTRKLPEHDLLFLRTDITDSAVVRGWVETIDQGVTATVLAEAAGELIGYCSLQQHDILWTRHLGEVLLLMNSKYRGQGIGGQLARQVITLAQGFDHLQKLIVQMMSTQRTAESLFHHLGFIPEALLHDWVIDRAGRTHDLIVMSREVDFEEDDEFRDED